VDNKDFWQVLIVPSAMREEITGRWERKSQFYISLRILSSHSSPCDNVL
jgi:hypothetical protein